ncbi:MAG: hypothetical protein B6241_02650 [Spirochaetaceae bacterium 4572_59]|nr:MAG: hypothetical protein B6241_02650 [Spirochaetaceae bacterium 4572_59]
MNQFSLGKKIFFLYPPVDFSRKFLRKQFENGYEIYTLNNTEKLEILLETFPDSVLFMNSDYPYEDYNIQKFIDVTLKQDMYKDLQVYSFFTESVSYGERIKDYISLDQPEQKISEALGKILQESNAHGKRAQVRFGSYSEVISQFTFKAGGRDHKADLHDISPKALSMSSESVLDDFMDQTLHDIHLTVGAYNIKVSGVLSQKREIGGKTLFIVTFDGKQYEKELFNFIYTSLEKKMDEIVHSL